MRFLGEFSAGAAHVAWVHKTGQLHNLGLFYKWPELPEQVHASLADFISLKSAQVACICLESSGH